MGSPGPHCQGAFPETARVVEDKGSPLAMTWGMHILPGAKTSCPLVHSVMASLSMSPEVSRPISPGPTRPKAQSHRIGGTQDTRPLGLPGPVLGAPWQCVPWLLLLDGGFGLTVEHVPWGLATVGLLRPNCFVPYR